MRIAVLADIHGNLPAFDAALAQVRAQGVDQIILAGDVINGCPDSVACWDLAQSLGCPILRGNHERYVADFATAAADPAWRTPKFAPLQWTVAQFGQAARPQFAALPATLRLPEAHELFFVHASGRDDHDTITAYTSETQLQAMFPQTTARYLVRVLELLETHRPVGATLEIDAAGRMLVARIGDLLIVPMPVDVLSWTAPISELFDDPALRAGRREMWLDGEATMRAQRELTRRGFSLRLDLPRSTRDTLPLPEGFVPG